MHSQEAARALKQLLEKSESELDRAFIAAVESNDLGAIITAAAEFRIFATNTATLDTLINQKFPDEDAEAEESGD